MVALTKKPGVFAGDYGAMVPAGPIALDEEGLALEVQGLAGVAGQDVALTQRVPNQFPHATLG